MMKNNLYKSAATVTAFSTVEKTLSFVYRVILSRAIGAEGIGIYQICLTVFSVFLTAASSGIPVTVSRLIAKQNAERNAYGKHAVVSAGMLCTLMFTVPAALIILFGRNLLGFVFSDESCLNIFLILVPGLILTSIYAVMRGFLYGNKQFLPCSVMELTETVVMAAVGCCLILFASTPTQGAFYATLAVLVSYIFSFSVSVAYYFIKGGKLVNPKRQLKPLIASAMPITAMRTSTAMLNSVISVFLPALLVAACGYSNSEAVAMYGAVMGMSLPILYTPNSLIGSISVVVAPAMSEDFYAERKENLKTDIEKSIKASILIATAVAPLLFALGEDLGVFLYSNAFSGTVIRRFAFMLLPMSISMITTTILNSMNYEVKTLIYFFISAVFMLVCIFTLTPLLGINSYMVGLSLGYCITAGLNLRLLHKHCPNLSYFRHVVSCLCICFFACLFGGLLREILGGLNIMIRIGVCGVLVFGFTALACYAEETLTTHPLKRLFARK